MLDLKEAYFNETKTQNPHLVAENPKNIAMIPLILETFKRLDEKLVFRGQYFATAMFLLYSLQFFYIVIQVTIMGESLDKNG